VIDEGVTKFDVEWIHADPLDLPEIDELIKWRRPLYDAGLVGEYADIGIGYGNISARVGDSERFVISGTQTGHVADTGPEHYALVSEVDINTNRVVCEGPVQASSEAMTHATIYALNESIHAVVHIHSTPLWLALKDKIPTTSADVPYGTPEMALEFRRLFVETDFCTTGVAVMAGHDDGLVSIGRSMSEAARRVLALKPG
jgi:L-ribulose-5-phosphate 4-epimerase